MSAPEEKPHRRTDGGLTGAFSAYDGAPASPPQPPPRPPSPPPSPPRSPSPGAGPGPEPHVEPPHAPPAHTRAGEAATSGTAEGGAAVPPRPAQPPRTPPEHDGQPPQPEDPPEDPAAAGTAPAAESSGGAGGTDRAAGPPPRKPGWPRRVGRALRRPPVAVARRIRRATHAQGAGESGLGKLIELHAVNSAGDMLITVALASTVFFSVPTGEARGRVALYLAVTMAPFVLLAPVVGPLLDRLPHGRRAAMAAAMLTRAVLAVAMAGAVATGGLELYPAALGVLVASKAYGTVRSAVVPRLLPPRISLVKANSRVTLAGLLATGAAAPVGAGLHSIGPAWPLYGACAVFAVGTFLSFSLDGKVDSARGERKARLAKGVRVHTRRKPGLRTVGAPVRSGLAGNAAIRALSGFLTFYLAFLLRDEPLPGMSAVLSLGVVAVAAGTGNALGTAIGAWLRDRGPEVIIIAVQCCALVATVVAAVLYGTVTVAVVAATAGIVQALGKLSLDALIQRDVPEEVRTSAFARSETLMQMSWVVGGGIGISLPLLAPLGMATGALVVAVGVGLSLRGLLSGGAQPRTA